MHTSLLDLLLSQFPAQTHALTLAHDPDCLLQWPELGASLAEAGFRILTAGDPVALRQAWYAAQPVDAGRPLIIATDAAVNTLPYDLWQQGVAVDLALHRFFPRLDSASLDGLTLAQLDRVFRAYQWQPPATTLSRGATVEYVLQHGFGATPAQLATPGPLLGWLAELHGRGDGLPPAYRAAVVALLRRRPSLAAWPLEELLADRDAFRRFAQAQWQGFIDSRMAERGVPYAALIPFASDPTAQAILPQLVSHGILTPVAVEEVAALPAWSAAGVRYDAQIGRLRRWQESMAAVNEMVGAGPQTWEAWQEIAGRWADLTVLRYAAEQLDGPEVDREYRTLGQRLAEPFAAWLRTEYPKLSARQLPAPHHLYHIPTHLAQHVAAHHRVALLVLDGMSLAAWRAIWAAWSARHPTWRSAERLVLAQIPTITAISRQALLAGRPPRAFADHMTSNQYEAGEWRAFWEQKGLPASAVAYAAVPDKMDRTMPDAIESLYTRVQAVVLPDIDKRVHGATQGLAGFHAALRAWLADGGNDGSGYVEALIQSLLDGGYRVAVTSDHGHVEAVGIGQPQEGVTVTTRSKRARLYANERFARNVLESFASSLLWYDDGILPDDRWVLMAAAGEAYATPGERVVSHGGITLDEVVVPYCEITETHE